jgi:hypothetical protein
MILPTLLVLGIMMLAVGALAGWLIGMTYPGMGGQQPPPQNSSPAGQLVPGVQPGTTGIIIANRVIIAGASGELLVYAPSAGAGNLLASISGQATTDSFSNTVEEGIASYATISGQVYAAQLGTVTTASGTLIGFFIQDLTSPANTPGGFLGAATNAGCEIQMYSGMSTGVSTGSLISCADSTFSGLANGEIIMNASAISGVINVPQTPTQTLQAAAPAAYSQSYTQGTVNRVNTLINQLQAAGVTA